MYCCGRFSRVIYNAINGDLIKSLRGHESTVYSVDFSGDGSHFASGGADNSVVIWKASGQGKLKYPHSAPIQRVKYNPVSFQLASCSDVSSKFLMHTLFANDLPALSQF